MPVSAQDRAGRMPRGQRRSQLLQAAQVVFADSGYHHSSMDAIATEASVSKPVLYQHFGSKRELYLAVMEELIADLTSRIVQSIEATGANKNRVKATIRAYFEFIAHENQAHRLIFENDFNDSEVQRLLDDYAARYATAIAEVIQQDTSLSLEQATLLGYALAGMSNVSASSWLKNKKSVPLDEAVHLIYQLAWRGISQLPR